MCVCRYVDKWIYINPYPPYSTIYWHKSKRKKEEKEGGGRGGECICKEEITFFLGVKVPISNFSQHSFPSKDLESLPSVH